MANPPPYSVSAPGRRPRSPPRARSPGAQARTQNSPPEAVGAAAHALHGPVQGGGQPDQEGVAGGMAEGVVVGLEPVEVEQQQQRVGQAGRDLAEALDGDLEPWPRAKEGLADSSGDRSATVARAPRTVRAISGPARSMKQASPMLSGNSRSR
jgi:hypothetical protein